MNAVRLMFGEEEIGLNQGLSKVENDTEQIWRILLKLTIAPF